jgi:hypothetical protein
MKLPLESLPKFSQNYSVGHGFTASCHRRRGVSKAVRAAEAVKPILRNITALCGRCASCRKCRCGPQLAHLRQSIVARFPYRIFADTLTTFSMSLARTGVDFCSATLETNSDFERTGEGRKRAR